jgi:hypothetical protein
VKIKNSIKGPNINYMKIKNNIKDRTQKLRTILKGKAQKLRTASKVITSQRKNMKIKNNIKDRM